MFATLSAALFALGLSTGPFLLLPDPGGQLAAILARHDAAVGGRAALEAVQALEIELDIVEPTYAAHGVYRADRRGRMRIDVAIGGTRVFTEAFDGLGGWQMDAHGRVTDASAAGTAALRHGLLTPDRLYGLHELPALGARLDYEGRETVDGRPYDVIKITLADGDTTWKYLDTETGLIVRSRDHRALHVDADPTKKDIETVASDFRVVSGVRRPFLTTDIDLRTGATLVTNTVTALRAVAGFDDAMFAKPAATLPARPRGAPDEAITVRQACDGPRPRPAAGRAAPSR